MSTRAQVRFATREAGQSFSQHANAIHAQFYVHSDGYPEHLGVEIAKSLATYQKIMRWEIEELTTKHGDLEYSMMLIQKFKQLYEASCKLHKIGYYKKWPPEYYEEVVATRQKTYERLFKKGVTS